MLAMLGGYIAALNSFRDNRVPPTTLLEPVPGGVSLMLVPREMDPEADILVANLLLTPSQDLVDERDRRMQRVEVDVGSAISTGTIVFEAGSRPAPQPIEVAVAGEVAYYPFDKYSIDTTLLVVTGDGEPLPVIAESYFRVPGWTFRAAADTTVGPQGDLRLNGEIQRDQTVVAIAVLLLALMVVLALIAIAFVMATLTRRVSLTVPVASFIAVLLFALLPIGSYFPGDPPSGVWMDIVVFFWVEAALMLCVAVIALSIIVRGLLDAREARRAAAAAGGDGRPPEPPAQ